MAASVGWRRRRRTDKRSRLRALDKEGQERQGKVGVQEDADAEEGNVESTWCHKPAVSAEELLSPEGQKKVDAWHRKSDCKWVSKTVWKLLPKHYWSLATGEQLLLFQSENLAMSSINFGSKCFRGRCKSCKWVQWQLQLCSGWEEQSIALPHMWQSWFRDLRKVP